MSLAEIAKLHSNQRLMLEEFLRRGIEVKVLVPELEIVEARLGGHTELLLDRDSSIVPYSASIICSNKYLVKKLLQRAGVWTPDGEQFTAAQLQDAVNWAAQQKGPLVVKPSNASHGQCCSTDVEDETALNQAIADIISEFGPSQPFLIEHQRPGMEFRVFISRRGHFAVLHRDPASVIGDGRRSIAELAHAETARRMNPRTNCLCPIVLDRAADRFLAQQRLSRTSVPKAGMKVYLRRNSNIALGGNCVDFTARAHHSVREIALAALECVSGLPYAGIDILSTDISALQNSAGCCVLEINSNPGLHMHMRPGVGQGTNVAAFMADLIFPESAATLQQTLTC